MNEKLQQLMKDKETTFSDLALALKIDKRTLTRKFNGQTDWTFDEMILLSKILEIEQPEQFFFRF